MARLTEGLTRLRLGDSDGARRLIVDGISTARETGNVDDMLYGLEASSEWLGANEHHADVVTLWTAADQTRLARKMPTQPVDQAWLAAGRARDERVLRADRYNPAVERGMSLGLDAALDGARESLLSAHISAAAIRTPSAAADRFRPHAA